MAAGKGTRLKSQLPKVLHEVGGKPLLAHVVAAATQVVPASDVFAVIGHEAGHDRVARMHCGSDLADSVIGPGGAGPIHAKTPVQRVFLDESQKSGRRARPVDVEAVYPGMTAWIR